MSIPIKNIYYLLCYAWDRFEEGKRVLVSDSDYDNALELFVRVLCNGCSHLYKRGFDQNYVEMTDEYPGIKGKINFRESINRDLFRKGRAICETDELTQNILANQLIKATLMKITAIKDLDPKMTKEVWSCYYHFTNVDDIEVSVSLFSRVRIHKNNAHYDFLLKICKLILENVVIDEATGSHYFKDFLRDEKKMAKVFEDFVRNFYKREQNEFYVHSETIRWHTESNDPADGRYLPRMQTDTSLDGKDRKIIIETKYYQNTLTEHFGSEKFNSGNLYQLFSYLKNIEHKLDHPKNKESEGVLLYPTSLKELNESYKIGGHSITLATVNLSQKWDEIYRALLSLISSSGKNKINFINYAQNLR